MSTMETVTSKVPKRVLDRLDDEADRRGVSRSTVIREHLEESVIDEEGESSGSSGGLLSQILSPSVSVFLAVALMLLAFGKVTFAFGALAISALSVLGMKRDFLPATKEATDSPMDARNFFRMGYISLSALIVVFLVLMYSGRLVLAGVAEILAFALAFPLAYGHLYVDEISEFSQDVLGELLVFNVGALVVIFGLLTGASATIVGVGGLLLIWGGVQILWSTAELCWEVIPLERVAASEEATVE